MKQNHSQYGGSSLLGILGIGAVLGVIGLAVTQRTAQDVNDASREQRELSAKMMAESGIIKLEQQIDAGAIVIKCDTKTIESTAALPTAMTFDKKSQQLSIKICTPPSSSDKNIFETINVSDPTQADLFDPTTCELYADVVIKAKSFQCAQKMVIVNSDATIWKRSLESKGTDKRPKKMAKVDIDARISVEPGAPSTPPPVAYGPAKCTPFCKPASYSRCAAGLDRDTNPNGCNSRCTSQSCWDAFKGGIGSSDWMMNAVKNNVTIGYMYDPRIKICTGATATIPQGVGSTVLSGPKTLQTCNYFLTCQTAATAVCGCDGRTFGSPEQAFGAGVTTFRPGSCQDPWDDAPNCYCPLGQVWSKGTSKCVDKPSTTACVGASGSLKQINTYVETILMPGYPKPVPTQFQRFETTISDPVCGCNAVTYRHECDAIDDGLKTWTKGACMLQEDMKGPVKAAPFQKHAQSLDDNNKGKGWTCTVQGVSHCADKNWKATGLKKVDAIREAQKACGLANAAVDPKSGLLYMTYMKTGYMAYLCCGNPASCTPN